MEDKKLDLNFNIIEDSKTAQKLVDTCANGVGAVAGSWFSVKNANTNAKIDLIKSQLQKDTKDIQEGKKFLNSKGELITNPEHAESDIIQAELQARFNFQEKKRQINLSSIAHKAKNFLSGKSVSEEPVGDDWTARFFNYAQDVTEEDMQDLWAKILAGEIEKPNSFSYSTLELLKNLSTHDAKLLENFFSYILDGHFFYEVYEERTYPFPFVDFLELHRMGVTYNYPSIGGLVNKSQPIKQINKIIITFIANGEIYTFHRDASENDKLELKCVALTPIGKELMNIIGNYKVNEDYLIKLENYLSKKGYHLNKDTHKNS